MELSFESADSKLFGLTIFLSVLAFQVAYILLQWYYIRRADYLYYIAYMLVAAVYTVGEFQHFLPFLPFGMLNPEALVFLKYSMPMLIAFFYYRFQRSFLSLPQTRPHLNAWVERLEYFVLAGSVFPPVLLALNASALAELYFAISIYAVIGVSSFFIIISFLKHSNPLTRFAMWGAGFILLGTMITLTIHYRMDMGEHFSFDPYVPLLICFIAELLTFTTGLSYKTRMIEFENAEQEKTLLREIQERQQLQIELLNVRSNIARDLHDEIGSGLSKISLLGEVIKRNETVSDSRIEKIISSSKEMVQSMREMIWSLNTNNDKLDNVIAHLRHYAAEYFDDTGIELTIEMPEQIPCLDILSQQRRVLMMIMKEAFNNVLKHSNADKLCMRVQLNGALVISIHDNGVGLSDKSTDYGNGLKNMQTRLEEIKGKFEIENHSGTKLTFHLPLPEMEDSPKG